MWHYSIIEFCIPALIVFSIFIFTSIRVISWALQDEEERCREKIFEITSCLVTHHGLINDKTTLCSSGRNRTCTTVKGIYANHFLFCIISNEMVSNSTISKKDYFTEGETLIFEC